MNWEEKYRSMPVPETDPCQVCRLADKCDKICPARARWWDRRIRGEQAKPQEVKDHETW